jgi:hypothetical protein
MLKNKTKKSAFLVAGMIGLAYGGTAFAGDCSLLPGHDVLTAALKESVAPNAGGTGPGNGGLDIPMWATMVDNRGQCC